MDNMPPVGTFKIFFLGSLLENDIEEPSDG